jgi:HD-GYP domain-containing protein (c-di-GMP phosphodiesterase class II)
LIYDASSAVVERMFSDPTSIVHHERAESLVQSTVQFLTADQWNFHSLLRMLSYDYTTYTHCVNVCAIGIALARNIGINEKEELNAIGLGLLMHDLGKSKISHAILNKRSMLSSTEMAEIRRHPLYGVELLRLNPRIKNLSREIVLHHHEKLNGSGYPHGLKDDEIPAITRIATIVDVFDALTTRRPYKKALRAYPALRIMRDEMSNEIDISILRVLISILAPKSKKIITIST